MIRLHRHITVLKLESPELQRELEAIGLLQEHTDVALNKVTHLLRKEETETLVKKLIKLGYKPRVEKP